MMWLLKGSLAWLVSSVVLVDLVPEAQCFLQSVGNVTHTVTLTLTDTQLTVTLTGICHSLPSCTFPAY